MSKKSKWLTGAAAGFVMAPMFATSSLADDVSAPSQFTRDNNVSVNERARPDYEALGTHAGGFFIYPRMTVGVLYDDNLYATPHGVADTALTLDPEVFVKSNWSRHELTLLAHGLFDEYARQPSQNAVNYGLDATGRLDIVRGAVITGQAGLDHLTEARTDPSSPLSASRPIQYDMATIGVGGSREFNRLKIDGNVTYENQAYQNAVTSTGAFLRQDDRNEGTTTETAQADYAVSPDTAIYFQATANQVRYQYTSLAGFPNRDSDGYNLSVGTNFDITHLIRGDIRIGYLAQTYKLSGFGTTSGPSALANVSWFPSELTTFTLKASRSIQEAVTVPGAVQTASGYVASDGQVAVDHELLRNVLLNAHASYENDAYQQQDRADNRTGAGLSGVYLLNRTVGLRLSYDYLSVRSSGAFAIPSYNENKIAGSLTLQY